MDVSAQRKPTPTDDPGDEWTLHRRSDGSFTVSDSKGKAATSLFYKMMAAATGDRQREVYLRVRPHSIETVVKPAIAKPSKRASSDKDQSVAARWEALRTKGSARKLDILNGENMLTAEALGAKLGVTKQTVHNRRAKHELIGLAGFKRGVRFPSEQLDLDEQPYAELVSLFGILDDDWAVYLFLAQEHEALGGQSGFAALRSGCGADVVGLAEALTRGHFA